MYCSHLMHVFIDVSSTFNVVCYTILLVYSITVPGKYSQPYYYDNNNNVLYDLQFIQADNGNHLLVVSGDPGILIYKWSDIEAAISAVLDDTADDDDDDDVTTATNNNKKPMMMCQDPKPNTTTNLIENIIPITTFTPHPSTAGGGGGGSSESIEINSTSYNSSNNLLYGAAGGFFGCYTWDLSSEKLLGTFGRAGGGSSGNGRGGRGGGGHHDYLHVVKSLPETSTIGSKTYVITGGEDGNMGFWDGRDQTLIEMVNMQSVMDKKKDFVTTTTASSNTTVSNSNRGFMSSTTSSATPWNGSSNLWVSSMDTCGDWLAVCGGCENTAGINNMSLTSRSSGPGTSGYTTLWHLPTRTFTSGCATRESVNAVIYNPTLDNFVSGGNEGRVSYWESTSLNRSGRSWSTPPAAYTMAVDSESNIMVVGGSGGILDCFVDRVKISQLQV